MLSACFKVFSSNIRSASASWSKLMTKKLSFFYFIRLESSTKNMNFAFYTFLISYSISSPLKAIPPFKKMRKIFSFFKFFTLSIDLLMQGRGSATIVWSLALIELSNYFLSIFYLFPFSIKLQTTLMSKQNYVIDIRSLFLICLLKIC